MISKVLIRNFFKQYLFFFLIIQVFRVLFFIVYFDKTAQNEFTDILTSFFYSFLLDNSATMYLMIVPFFLYFLYSIFQIKFFLNINRIYSYIMIVLLVVIESSNIAIYNEWGIKLNYKAIGYLADPTEAIRSARMSVLIPGLLTILFLSFVLIWSFNKLKLCKLEKKPFSLWFSILWMLIMPVVIFVSMRGSMQQIPISQSQSYHSKSNFVNTATVNTSWNLFHSILQNSQYMDVNPFVFTSLELAKQRVERLYDYPTEKGISLFKVENPNVVLVFLESWSGDFIDELGGDMHITPGFSKLTKEGFLFTNHYASGMLSHQGISAVFSGFPSTPLTSIIKQPAKYHNLSCFIEDFKSRDYHTSFHFGGQLIYGNIKAYIYYNGFDEIIEGADFDGDIPTGSLGHHDEYLYDRLLEDINSYPKPFFAGAFTLSSHSPFDQPVNDFVDKGGKYKAMINSVYYSDSCIYDFIEKAKKQDWYENTLFVFVADHSHPSPYEYPYYSKELRKIPLLFYGEVIKDEYRGQTFDSIMSQTDIAATLLSQLNMPFDKFQWSKDVFNPQAPQFAYYGYDNGFGWITPTGNFAYLMGGKIIEYKFDSKADSTKLTRNGKAFVETLYQQYLDY